MRVRLPSAPPIWAIISMVDGLFYTEKVAGSSPASPTILGWIQQNGGLQGALAKLQGAGLGGQVQSWVDPSKGNGAVDVSQIQSLFGGQQVEQVAQQANVPTNEVYGAISTVLPQIIDSLTPQGDATDHNEANGDIQNVLNMVSGFLK